MADQPAAATDTANQPNRRQVRLRVSEANLTTGYVNAFRTHTSAEEFILDMGMNVAVTPTAPAGEAAPDGEVLFDARHRAVMNYYTAKRLALLLSQAVRQHEERFGELKLNAADRAAK